MKIENINRVNKIVELIEQKHRTIESLKSSEFVAITTPGGFVNIEIPLAITKNNDWNYGDLAIKFRDEIVDRICSEISDLEDELETL